MVLCDSLPRVACYGSCRIRNYELEELVTRSAALWLYWSLVTLGRMMVPSEIPEVRIVFHDGALFAVWLLKPCLDCGWHDKG